MFHVIFVVFVVSKMMGQDVAHAGDYLHGRTQFLLILWWAGVSVQSRR